MENEEGDKRKMLG